MMTDLSGRCLCGGVQFTATGEVMRVSACHCQMCRMHNGGGPFYGAEIEGKLTLPKEASLKWYRSSEMAERGFCRDCGSTLFWRRKDNPAVMDISLGALGADADFKIDAHIFADQCGAYETLPSDAPHINAGASSLETSEE